MEWINEFRLRQVIGADVATFVRAIPTSGVVRFRRAALRETSVCTTATATWDQLRNVKKQRILAEALRLFYANGYRGTSLDAIAGRCRCPLRALSPSNEEA